MCSPDAALERVPALIAPPFPPSPTRPASPSASPGSCSCKCTSDESSSKQGGSGGGGGRRGCSATKTFQPDHSNFAGFRINLHNPKVSLPPSSLVCSPLGCRNCEMLRACDNCQNVDFQRGFEFKIRPRYTLQLLLFSLQLLSVVKMRFGIGIIRGGYQVTYVPLF